jgi:hypothetical protein
MLHPVNVGGFIQTNGDIRDVIGGFLSGRKIFRPYAFNSLVMTLYPWSISTREFTSVNLEL